MFLGASFAAPTYALVQALAPLRMRAMASAVLLFILNLIGLGLGPTIVGVLNDVLHPRFGDEAIRVSLLLLCFLTCGACCIPRSRRAASGRRRGARCEITAENPGSERHGCRSRAWYLRGVNQALLDHFDEQAGFCEAFGSPFTARLIEAMAGDLAAGGPIADLVGDWSGHPRADAVSLRLTGALHTAALSGRDPALAAEYPAARPDWDAERVWRSARAFLARDRAWAADFLRFAPQTNETRRSIALLAGFLAVAARFARPLDLLEIGASAGLNVSWDRFAYRTGSWSWGTPGGPLIETAWTGPPPRSTHPSRSGRGRRAT